MPLILNIIVTWNPFFCSQHTDPFIAEPPFNVCRGVAMSIPKIKNFLIWVLMKFEDGIVPLVSTSNSRFNLRRELKKRVTEIVKNK
jgi:hypothetical protein